MTLFFQHFIEQLIATSFWEWIAVILAIAYLILVIRENNWCWPAAFVSTAIYSVLFFDVNLYMESLLNIYYLVMAIYGWFQWNKIANNTLQKNNHQGNSTLSIQKWSQKKHLILILTTSILVLISAYLLNRFTNQELALIDSFTTWFAVLTTYMVTQKILENWLYWIIIDCISIFIYIEKGFALTAVLFVVYILLAIFGWFAWKKEYNNAKFKQA